MYIHIQHATSDEGHFIENTSFSNNSQYQQRTFAENIHFVKIAWFGPQTMHLNMKYEYFSQIYLSSNILSRTHRIYINIYTYIYIERYMFRFTIRLPHPVLP